MPRGLTNCAPESKPVQADMAALLDLVAAYIRRFVALSAAQKTVIAVWVVHTYILSAIDCTAYLAITSAEKLSGKTRLLEVLETLVANPWLTGRVTAAVLIRKVDAEQPTLLLDESDAAFGGEKEYAEALRGVLNSGYRRSGKASCCIRKGQETSFKDFSTFCPKAIAGIGKLPDTVADRSIPIRLKRTARGEDSVQKFRQRDVEAEAAGLRRRIESLAIRIVETVRNARPQMPDELNDRQQDALESLLAIANLAGAKWPEAMRIALVSLCVEAQDANESVGQNLLSDIRAIFDDKGMDRIRSSELVKSLAELEASPWSEWSHGKPITQVKVANLLRPYGITPHNVRIGDKIPKCYEREDFADDWKRYLRPPDSLSSAQPGPQSATPLRANTDEGFHDFSNRNTKEDVPAPKCEIVNKDTPCSGVAVSEVPLAREGTEEDL